MILINLQNIHKAYGTDIIMDNVSLTLNSGDKLGLIGPNGAGKTTLFRIILGELPPDNGDVFITKGLKIGYVKQNSIAVNDNNTIWGELESGFAHIINLENWIDDINAQLEDPRSDHDALVKKQASLNEEFNRLDGFGYKNRIRAALLGLGFCEDEFNKPVRLLSGGQRTRLSLGKTLLGDNDVLLLDEPTNNLDINSCEWLEGFLQTYKGAFIVVSHDRYFLDKVTTVTIGIEHKKSTAYSGNYSAYQKQKESEFEIASRHYENYQKEVKRIEAIIEQQRRWNREKNIKTAESKQKQIDRMEIPDIPLQAESGISFNFTLQENCGNEVFSAVGLSKAFDSVLFEQADLDITKGERVFLLGDNGTGKTTLLKIILGELAPDNGSFKFGTNVHPGYYSQVRTDLGPENTVIDEVWNDSPKLTQTQIRNALAAFLFRGDDVYKQIKHLSGGEAGRVALVKLMLSKSNFLLLDEPTNHLDILSKEALERALLNYEGTLFVISHDRYFINKLASRIYCLENKGFTNYIGDYDYFSERHKKTQAVKEQTAKSVNNSYKERKEQESNLRKLKGKILRCEERIGDLEKQINEIEATLAKPDIATDYVKATEISEQLATIKSELESEYENWGNLTE